MKSALWQTKNRGNLKLTQHALAGLAASLRQGTPVIALVLGPVLIAFLALMVWPVLDASTRSTPRMLITIAAQTILGALPFFALRHRLLPPDFLAWERTLPTRRRARCAGDGLAAGLALAPRFLAYGVSTAIWFWQSLAWLQPVRLPALCAIAATALGTWMTAWVVLSAAREWPWQYRRHTPATLSVRTINLLAPSTTNTTWRPVYFLIILPFFRTGRRRASALQAILLIMATVSTYAWLGSKTGSTVLPALTTSALFLILIMHADFHGRALGLQLEPAIRHWPIRPSFIFGACRCLTLLPGIIELVIFATLYGARADHHSPELAIAWLSIAAATLAWVIYWSRPATAIRCAGLLLAFSLLSAVGNTL